MCVIWIYKMISILVYVCVYDRTHAVVTSTRDMEGTADW